MFSIKEKWNKSEEKPILIRYADDFVILHSNEELLEQCSQRVKAFLEEMGLWLNNKKTRMTHTLMVYEGNVGFDFLGFTIRQFPVGKYRTGTCTGKALGFKTIIKPAKEAIKRHMKTIGDTIRKYGSVPQEKVIAELNPKIRGWANYYKTVVARETFSRCDHILWRQLWRWGTRRHNSKGSQWVKRKYWKRVEKRDWVFSTPDEKFQCLYHCMTPIQRHIKVKGTRSPYDGDFTYWSQRLSNHPMLQRGIPFLLKKQKGLCRMCHLRFKDGDLIEIDHITPRSHGGKDEPSNLMALHRHCHDRRHHEMSKAGITI